MSQGASLGVLLPTRNSTALLPDHLAAMADWLDMADEVLAVDSDSQDGTQELLRQKLKQPGVRFLSHPPGLYVSWNAGLKELTTEFAYISTVGETITRHGLQQLLDVARESPADVVVSKPAFKTLAGGAVEVTWPIDDIVRTLRITSPRRLQRLEAMVFACAHATGALTGSCASDLFRTDCLKRFPFPTEFGTSGDGIWSIRHAAQVSWAVVPGCFSTFLLHPTAASQSENRPRPWAPRPDIVLRNAVEVWRQQGLVTDDDLAQLHWSELQTALTGYLDEKATFDRYRQSKVPWVLNAWAWRARRRRERQQARLYACQESALRAAASREQARPSRGGAGSEGHPSCATA